MYGVSLIVRTAAGIALREAAKAIAAKVARDLLEQHLKEHADRLIRRDYAALDEKLARRAKDGQEAGQGEQA